MRAHGDGHCALGISRVELASLLLDKGRHHPQGPEQSLHKNLLECLSIRDLALSDLSSISVDSQWPECTDLLNFSPYKYVPPLAGLEISSPFPSIFSRKSSPWLASKSLPLERCVTTCYDTFDHQPFSSFWTSFFLIAIRCRS